MKTMILLLVAALAACHVGDDSADFRVVLTEGGFAVHVEDQESFDSIVGTTPVQITDGTFVAEMFVPLDVESPIELGSHLDLIAQRDGVEPGAKLATVQLVDDLDDAPLAESGGGCNPIHYLGFCRKSSSWRDLDCPGSRPYHSLYYRRFSTPGWRSTALVYAFDGGSCAKYHNTCGSSVCYSR